MIGSVAFAAMLAFASAANVTYYDSYNNTELNTTQVAARDAEGTTFYCVNAVTTCNSSESRRIDGSCNRLAAPYEGAGHAQFDRLLTAEFNGSDPRLAANGSALPNARHIRTQLLAEGEVDGQNYTQLMMLYFVFAATDIAAMSIHDTLNYVTTHPNCCSASGANDSMCFPTPVPADDPIHRFSGISCLNMTRPISFQSAGCISNTTTPPHRVNYGTPQFDLSNMYGNDNSTSTRQRLWSGGLLNYTNTTTGKQWPQYIAPSVNRRDGIQGLTGVNYLFGLWFWREHNRIAAELATLNPCWSDEQLFSTARDINIAQYMQMTFYELFATIMGTENLQNDDVLGTNSSFRDPYDSTLSPALYIESLLALRWVHTILDPKIKMVNTDGETVGEYPEVNLTLSTNSLNSNTVNLTYLTLGSYRDTAAKRDNIVDPIVGELGLGPLQKVTDLTTNDIVKNRLFGIPSWTKWLNYCYEPSAEYVDFDDVSIYIDDSERLERLSLVYNNVTDIDLIAGMWLEPVIPGGTVPMTFYCLVTKQLQRIVATDRHWYERSGRPNAFTEDQLLSIRNATVAGLLCNNGDSVSSIQPSAFLKISDSNPLTSCDDIPTVNLTLWQETTCTTTS